MSKKLPKTDFTRKITKSPNVNKSCPKMKDFNTFTKLLKNVGDLDKLVVAKGFKKSNKSPNLVTLLIGMQKKIFQSTLAPIPIL